MKVVAVSGGVDSMVMLDLLCQKYPAKELLVAHFNHNARPSARADFEFVRDFCAEKGLKFVSKTMLCDSSPGLTEERARKNRYNFLFSLDGNAVYVAHHLDDLVESIAINLIRGTGWRGLAVMNRPGLRRPLIDGGFDGKIYDHRDVLHYAAEHNIPFRQDPTNTEVTYLRNRLRPEVLDLPRKTKEKLLKLRNRACEITEALQREIEAILPEGTAIPRQLFRELPDDVALEVLRYITEVRYHVPCTRPQLQDFLTAVREYQPGKQFNLPGGQMVEIGREYFRLR